MDAFILFLVILFRLLPRRILPNPRFRHGEKTHHGPNDPLLSSTHVPDNHLPDRIPPHLRSIIIPLPSPRPRSRQLILRPHPPQIHHHIAQSRETILPTRTKLSDLVEHGRCRDARAESRPNARLTSSNGSRVGHISANAVLAAPRENPTRPFLHGRNPRALAASMAIGHESARISPSPTKNNTGVLQRHRRIQFRLRLPRGEHGRLLPTITDDRSNPASNVSLLRLTNIRHELRGYKIAHKTTHRRRAEEYDRDVPSYGSLSAAVAIRGYGYGHWEGNRGYGGHDTKLRVGYRHKGYFDASVDVRPIFLLMMFGQEMAMPQN